MDNRVEQLAAQFMHISDDVLAFVTPCPAHDWRLITREERWSVGVVCRHIARGFEVHPQLIARAASGAPMPTDYTWEMIHQSNAEQAREWADCTQEEVIALLQRHRDAAANTIRALSDAQLDRTVSFPIAGDTPITVQQIVEGMIDHPRPHLESIRATIAAQSP